MRIQPFAGHDSIFANILLVDKAGVLIFDGIASTVTGLNLGGTAILLAYETKGLLIGERANENVVNGIQNITSKFDGINTINEVLTMHMGPDFGKYQQRLLG